MNVKKGNTYYQDRRKERIDPKLLEVLDVEEVVCGHEICKVRWYVIRKDKAYPSVFPMATIRIGEFADFKPMSRKIYKECVDILKNAEVYANARRRVLYRINKLKENIIHPHHQVPTALLPPESVEPSP